MPWFKTKPFKAQKPINPQPTREDISAKLRQQEENLRRQPRPETIVAKMGGGNAKAHSAPTPPRSAAPARQVPAPQVESHESFMARAFPDRQRAGVRIREERPSGVVASGPERREIPADRAARPVAAQPAASAQSLLRIRYDGAPLPSSPAGPTEQELQQAAAETALRTAADDRLRDALQRGTPPRQLTTSERQLLEEEQAHRSWMAERFPKEAKAAGYETPRWDIAARRPVESRDFSY